MTTIAMIMATLLPKEVQNFSSFSSLAQFSSPIHLGGRIPRYLVKLRYTFHTSGIKTTPVSKTKPGSRYHQNPRPPLAGSRLSLWRIFGRRDETVDGAVIAVPSAGAVWEVEDGVKAGSLNRGLHPSSGWSY
jgi:hypothetical protein